MSSASRLRQVMQVSLAARAAAVRLPSVFGLARARAPSSTLPAIVASAAAASAPRSFSSAVQASAAASAQSPKTLAELSDSFMTGTNAAWLDRLYLLWQENSTAVPKEWAEYFKRVDAGSPSASSFKKPSFSAVAAASGIESPSSHVETVKVLLLIRAYEVRGHTLANLDPLGLDVPEYVPELKLDYYGLSEGTMFDPRKLGTDGAFLGDAELSIADIVSKLRKIYCRTIGYEYMHIQSRDECNFIRERLQTRHEYFWITDSDKKRLLDRLTWSDQFEAFLKRSYGYEKRFGLEGCESLIPGLKELIDCASDFGVETVIFGMPHRGRLNVLANVVRKPVETIFAEFAGQFQEVHAATGAGSGDVKYHLGSSYDRVTRAGKNIHLHLLANPSHLEAVNPVVLGLARAKQHVRGTSAIGAPNTDAAAKSALVSEAPEPAVKAARGRVMPVLLHGDAAFAGQGIVYEGLHLSELPNYTVGGTVHVIVNNQVGFTTDPKDGRSSRYCTDVAKTLGVPVLHANGDDPEAVVKCMRFAAMWRAQFQRDIVVDIVCYRRLGHNEVDEPSFTQPLMKKRIDSHRTTLELYTERLVKKGVVTAEEAAGMLSSTLEMLNERKNGKALSPATPAARDAALHTNSAWAALQSHTLAPPKRTNIDRPLLDEVFAAITCAPPVGFTLHPTLARVIQTKRTHYAAGSVDWGSAEALAIGSLLTEGSHVRLSGQDVQRGTFSHRHAVYHCQDTNALFTPLNTLAASGVARDGRPRERVTICNSPLDEYAVLGFEYGYSLASPSFLSLWEAQFGDFSNGAQVMIDQFINAGEQKWGQLSGLVMLLPHGFDGQGPEHSSARLERFLQMSDQDWDTMPDERTLIQAHSWQICNITTPANYFHILRRQIHSDLRKPLVIMSPKGLLRSELSPLSEFTDTQFFRPIIGETAALATPAAKVRRVILCSGQVYFELVKKRKALGVTDVAIVRVEQLAPLPSNMIAAELAKYPNAGVMWAQEEAKNHGAYSYILPHLHTIINAAGLKNKGVRYAGRQVAAAPATGHKLQHVAQLDALLDAAFKP